MTNLDAVTNIFLFASVAFVLGILLTPLLTHFLYKYRITKQLREQSWDNTATPVFQKLHKTKHGTPTMGGILIWVTAGIITLLFNFSRSQTWLPIFTLFASGGLGLIDDMMNVRGINKIKGLGIKAKFLSQFIIAGIGGWWFAYKLGFTTIGLPLSTAFNFPASIEVGALFYAILFALVVVFISNAVNITDGLDGLAGGILASSFGAFTAICFFQGKFGLAVFCATILGALLAFLWFNIYPARFFMGDTGAFALGSTLAVVAMLTDSLIVLPIIGAVFVIEACSSILQRFWKKFLHRKLFISAPLHHHLEALGWPETKVTMRFWIISAVSAAAGVALNLIGR